MPLFSSRNIITETPVADTNNNGLLPVLSGSATDFLNGSGVFSTPAGGGGSNQYSASIVANAAQAINDSTWTRIELPVLGHDNHGSMADIVNDEIDIQETGYYRGLAHIGLDMRDMDVDKEWQFAVSLVGSGALAQDQWEPKDSYGGATWTQFICPFEGQFSSGGQIFFQCYHDQGAARTLDGNTRHFRAELAVWKVD